MSDMHSFDAVSKIDMQEVNNAVTMAMKEIGQRFDFKGSKSDISIEKEELVLVSDDEGKLKSVVDILTGKLVKRAVPLKGLDFGKIEPASGGTVRQRVKIQQGIPGDKAKEIVKRIKETKLKVQAAIQEDQVRVSGKKLDDLQTVMKMMREADFGVALQFVNYR
ncbi:MAG: YajQ family cyclic di-GMP-binding protein [Nitrospirae bacterium RBG_16_64_22]|nr:MAG: YajQ family cyclic di-GMP-binding protein [Nitrospirae bacterium RBG_16_64_22]